MVTRKFKLIQGGLAGLDDFIAEFTSNAASFDFSALSLDDNDEQNNQSELSPEALREFMTVTAPPETDQFIFNSGPFLVDLT